MKKNIYTVMFFCIPCLVSAEIPAKKEVSDQVVSGKNYFVFGLGIGSMQQNDRFVALEDAGASFIKVQQPYAVNTVLGTVYTGFETFQGFTYLGAFIYGTLTPLNKKIYCSSLNGDTMEEIFVRASGSIGTKLHFGVKLNDVTPYGILGIQYGPRYMRYVVKYGDTNPDITYKNKSPIFLFGIGLMGDVSDNMSLGIEYIHKTSREFNVQLPNSSGDLSEDFLRVNTARWSVTLNLTYRINIG